ncbi:mucin-19-like [Camelus bactrianus]|uniref:Mucin-19-like n=1 Tax=Camelus bactrianus TaxID=9837 RepID=A0AC58R9C0_CAMBA
MFLYLVVALCVFCKDGEALFYRLNSDDETAESEAGDTSLRSEDTFVAGSSGNLKFYLGASDQQGFGINEIGGDELSGSGYIGAGFKGLGLDASNSGDISLGNQNTFVDDSFGNSESNLGASEQQGFGITEIAGDGLSASESVEDGLKGFAPDASTSGIAFSLCSWEIQLDGFQIFVIFFNNILIFLFVGKLEFFDLGLEGKTFEKNVLNHKIY